MNWLDIVILVMLVVPAFTGLRAGIIKVALSLAGLILGVVLAGRFYEPLSGKLTFIPGESLANIAAFAIILIAVMLVAGIVASVLKLMVSAVMLGWVNHLGGAALGLVLGAIFAGVLLAAWAKYLGGENVIASSALASLLLDRAPLALALLPGEFDVVRGLFR